MGGNIWWDVYERDTEDMFLGEPDLVAFSKLFYSLLAAMGVKAYADLSEIGGFRQSFC